MKATAVSEPVAETRLFRTLDGEFWQNFLRQTAFFSQTAVFRDVLTLPQVDRMSQYTMEALRQICIRASSMNGFRVYLGNREQSEAYKQEHLFSAPPLPGENISNWAERVFGPQKFGIIINQIEKFSGPLAEAISSLIHPLLAEAGIPLNGFHTSTFIGNYGYTPLGIHQDHQGSSVIHFHLGPADKVMYTWDEALYQQLAGGRTNNQEIEPLLPEATAYAFGTGDLYFMPWNQFHVGYTDELSVGLTFWFDNHTSEVILNKLFDLLRGKSINRKQKKVTTPQQARQNFSNFPEVMEAFDSTLFPPQISVRDLLKTLYDESMLTLFSNGGWRFKPLARRREPQADGSLALLAGRVQTIYPFRLYYRVASEELMLLYARGSEFQVPNDAELIRLIDRLNDGEAVATRQLLEEMADWPSETILYLLQLLIDCQALRLNP